MTLIEPISGFLLTSNSCNTAVRLMFKDTKPSKVPAFDVTWIGILIVPFSVPPSYFRGN